MNVQGILPRLRNHELVDELRRRLALSTEPERSMLIASLLKGYCKECLAQLDLTPCTCTRDE